MRPTLQQADHRGARFDVGPLRPGGHQRQRVAGLRLLQHRRTGIGLIVQHGPANRHPQHVRVQPGEPGLHVGTGWKCNALRQAHASTRIRSGQRMRGLSQHHRRAAAAQRGLEDGVLVRLAARVLGVVLVDHDRVGVKRVEVLHQLGQKDTRRAGIGQQFRRLGRPIDVDQRHLRVAGVVNAPLGQWVVQFGGQAALVQLRNTARIGLKRGPAHHMQVFQHQRKQDQAQRNHRPELAQLAHEPRLGCGLSGCRSCGHSPPLAGAPAGGPSAKSVLSSLRLITGFCCRWYCL